MKSQTKQTTPIEYKKIQNYIFAFNDVIGKGNFSRVYRGRHELTNEVVAVKVVQLASLTTTRMHELLNSETKVLRKLHHPNIIKCEDILSSARNCYIITELCEDGNLEQELHAHGKYSEQEIMPIVRDIYLGLEYLHGQAIIHRDIKISNVLKSKGVHKIGDFGFAALSGEDFQDISIGSPLYMAPEGYIDNVYGPKTDVWSLGILLVELLTGKTPFSACKNEQELRQEMLKEINVKELCPHASVQLQQLLQRCLAKNSAHRISMEEIRKCEWMNKCLHGTDELSYTLKLNKDPIDNFSINNVDISVPSFMYNHSMEVNGDSSKNHPPNLKNRLSPAVNEESKLFLENLREKRNITTMNVKEGKKDTHFSEYKKMYTYSQDKNKLHKRSERKENKYEQVQSPAKYLHNFHPLEKKKYTQHYPKSYAKQNAYLDLHSKSPERTPTSWQQNKENIFQNQVKNEELKESIAPVLSIKTIKFAECVNVIHYCRLGYKYACLLSEQKGEEEMVKLMVGWAVQILAELMKKINDGDIVYGNQDNLLYNPSLLQEESKNEERRKKLKDVTDQYLTKYQSKLKGKHAKHSTAHILSTIQDHYKKQWLKFTDLKYHLNSQQCATYAYLITLCKQTQRIHDYSIHLISTLENKSVEKLLTQKIGSFTLTDVESLHKCSGLN